MAIAIHHIPIYRTLFKIPGFFSEPFLMLGYQDIIQHQGMPEDFRYQDVKHLLMSKGLKAIKTLDLFDKRADLKYDLNCAVPEFERQAYNVVLDIGTLGHIFDTRQALENCLRMVAVNGLYILHTAVKGYFGHSLHVFNPEGLIGALQLNNFKIVSVQYSTGGGAQLRDPADGNNVLMWMAAKKIKEMDAFNIPQQECWIHEYNRSSHDDREHSPTTSFVKKWMRCTVVHILRPIWRVLMYIKIKLENSLDI